ncbi:MAG: hypothetical protein CM1200mP28_18010 [Deltaproteobacteria bacterium]|nr:MAG: hypothetical protein CM1200mP28_18010 [Deltaproteobacteria bacterium]
MPVIIAEKAFFACLWRCTDDENPYLSILQTYTETGKEVAMVALPESSKEFGNVYLDHEMKISRLNLETFR